jgi:predicted nuclease of predicted toxin-antitoxin system
MLLIADEDVPRSVIDFLLNRGHEVLLATEAFMPAAADATIAAGADKRGAIVVTCDKDFDRLIQRNKLRFRLAGRISFRCSQARTRMRLEQVIDLIEFEFQRRQAFQDKRVIVEVKDSNLVFHG